MLNQVLVRFDDSDERTRDVIARIQADGTAFLGGATWFGKQVMRVSVINWSTREGDIDRSVAAVRRRSTPRVLPADQPARRVAAIVLAAGAASRFAAGAGPAGAKVLARLEGKPLLQHVLDAVAMAPVRDVVVVAGPDAAALDEAIAWRSERRVTNPHPENGLASSLQVGLTALEPESARPSSSSPTSRASARS